VIPSLLRRFVAHHGDSVTGRLIASALPLSV
jgi:hypothetical protein